MARVARFEQLAPGNDKVHGPVICGWKVFTKDGESYVQLDTYGSEERKLIGKVSQSVQFDRQSAAELAKILRRAFPNPDAD